MPKSEDVRLELLMWFGFSVLVALSPYLAKVLILYIQDSLPENILSLFSDGGLFLIGLCTASDGMVRSIQLRVSTISTDCDKITSTFFLLGNLVIVIVCCIAYGAISELQTNSTHNLSPNNIAECSLGVILFAIIFTGFNIVLENRQQKRGETV